MSLANAEYRKLYEAGQLEIFNNSAQPVPIGAIHPCSFLLSSPAVHYSCGFEVQRQVGEKWTTEWCKASDFGNTEAFYFTPADDFRLTAETFNELIQNAVDYAESLGWVILPERQMALCPYHAEWKDVFA